VVQSQDMPPGWVPCSTPDPSSCITIAQTRQSTLKWILAYSEFLNDKASNIEIALDQKTFVRALHQDTLSTEIQMQKTEFTLIQLLVSS
jgi:hypothetical protein